MLTFAATAARIARLPLWYQVPSPRLQKMCFSDVNGAWPIHGAPSPPMCVNVDVRRSIQIAITWQPMPAVARLPSGTLVDVLCGQPEQNHGLRSSMIFDLASVCSF